MKTRHMTNTDQKIDELNSYIEEQFCSRDKILEQLEIEELERYGRRLCLRFQGIPTEKNETIDKVLENITGICKESGIGIPDTVIDRAHRIGVPYVNKTTDVRVPLFSFLLFVTEQ